MELNPTEESGTRQHLLEPLDLFEHRNGMLSLSLPVPLEAGLPINSAIVNSEGGAPGSVIHLRLRYHLLPFLVRVAISKLLNFFKFSYLPEEWQHLLFPWLRQGWPR